MTSVGQLESSGSRMKEGFHGFSDYTLPRGDVSLFWGVQKGAEGEIPPLLSVKSAQQECKNSRIVGETTGHPAVCHALAASGSNTAEAR